MANNYWWNKYYKRCHAPKEEYEEYGFEKGELMQGGYEPTFEDFVEVKSKYFKYLGEGELGIVLLGQDNKLYFTYGPFLEEVTEDQILNIINS